MKYFKYLKYRLYLGNFPGITCNWKGQSDNYPQNFEPAD